MSKLTDNIETKIKEDVVSLGYEIEYVEYVKEGEQRILRIVIDKEDTSLTTEDCEIVSRKIEDKVDSNMAKDDTYILEISSPGLERALKNTKLFKKYIGYKVRVKLFKKINEKKELIGTLLEADDENVIMLVEDNKIEIERENIAAANTVYDF